MAVRVQAGITTESCRYLPGRRKSAGQISRFILGENKMAAIKYFTIYHYSNRHYLLVFYFDLSSFPDGEMGVSS